MSKRLNLHDALSQYSYDHGVICTYTFDPDFFEKYCLEKLNSLSNNRNLTVIVDRGTYEKLILGPLSGRPEQANIRYLFHPVSVSGVFHPKLFLFADKKKGRLIIGSANFTQQGITSNAELAGCYDYDEEKDTRFGFLFRSAFAFLAKLNSRWPSKALESNLRTIERGAPWLAAEQDEQDESTIKLLDNLDSSLWKQIVSNVEPPVDGLYILSRFFDSDPALLDRVNKDLRPNKIRIFTQNGSTTLTKDYLRHSLVKSKKAEILLCKYPDENNSQSLHAKAIVIEKDNKYAFAFGSANFTSSALLKRAGRGNVEMLLLVRELAAADFDPQKLFDPNKTAKLLKNEEGLHTASREEKFPSGPAYEIKLFEASFENDLHIHADIPETFVSDQLFAKLFLQGDIQKLLLLSSFGDNRYSAPVAEAIKRHLDEASSIVQIEACRFGATTATSNRLLVTNLKDIQTGKSVRRERHIKEAQQSADQFVGVVNDLINTGDEDALKIFLTYCDIRVIDADRPRFFVSLRPAWDGSVGMKKLGERNLKVFDGLHEAALGFVNRHFTRLRQHLDYGTLNGVSNFMHIFRAMGTVVFMQVNRAVHGLELKTGPMSAEEWAACRNRLGLYYTQFEEMMRFLWGDYLTMMLKEYEYIAVKQRIMPDLDPIREHCSEMLCVRQRIEAAINSRLRVKTLRGELLKPPYYSSILSQERWSKFDNAIKVVLSGIENALA